MWAWTGDVVLREAQVSGVALSPLMATCECPVWKTWGSIQIQGIASGQSTLCRYDQSRLAETLSYSSAHLGVTVFPIGIGDRYDPNQLRILAGPDASSNVVKLQRIEDLPTMVTLGNSFLHKLCSGESGNIFLPPTLKKLKQKQQSPFQRPEGAHAQEFGLKGRLIYRPGSLSFYLWKVCTMNLQGATRQLFPNCPSKSPCSVVHRHLR